MTKSAFVDAFYDDAMSVQKSSGISAIAILVQAAWESAWGKAAPGFMFFGVKDTDGINGNEQLLVTTEYSIYPNLKFPEIISITPVVRNGRKIFKYKVRDYFRKYASPEECFADHAKFFAKNRRYKAALAVRHDPRLFIDAIAKAGYATDPNYAASLKSMIKSIENEISKRGKR